MSTFVFAYRMPPDFKPGRPDVVGSWSSWFESMGPGLIELGKPVFARGAAGSCPSETVLGGYSIISAENLDAALAIAQGCPALAEGGGVEVGELGEPGSVRRSSAAAYAEANL